LSRHHAIYAVPAAAWVAFAVWLYHDHVQKVETERASLRAQGDAILVALESGIRGLSRPRGGREGHFKSAVAGLLKKMAAEKAALEKQGKEVSAELESRIDALSKFKIGRIEQLKASLEELAQNPSVLGVAIMDKHSRPIVSAGDADRLAIDMPPGTQYLWLQDALLVARTVEASPMGWLHDAFRAMPPSLGSSPYHGKGRWRGRTPFGRGGPPPFRKQTANELGPIQARLLMSRGQLDAVLRQHVRMALTTGAIGLLAAVILAGAWRATIRNREHVAALELAEAQTQHLREMQLAGAGLAHEMKNPLNVLRATTQSMLHHGRRTPTERQALERMLDEIDRIVSRLNGFLSFSRVPELEWANVSAKQVVEEVVALLKHGAETGTPRIAVESLPAIRADAALFRQLVFNLLHNAMRATDESGTVRVRAVRSAPSRITLEISDTGIGVPVALREKLFRPYCSGWEGGTGLGLSIVRQIALAHGWKAGYRPNADRGSTFWVSDIEERGDEATRESEENSRR